MLRTQKRVDKNSINAIWKIPRAEISDVVVAEIVPVLVAEMVPVPVAEMVPVPVAEMVPVPVAEMVPVLVAEIVPDLGNAVAEKATTNMPAKAIDLTFFIILLLLVSTSGVTWSALRFSRAKPYPSSRPITNS